MTITNIQAAPQSLADALNTIIGLGNNILGIRLSRSASVYIVSYETSAVPTDSYVLNEDGTFVLNEDGTKVVLE